MAAAVYLIFGDEYLVSLKAREIVDSLVPPADQAFGLEVVDGNAENIESAIRAVDRCVEAVRTVGFMGAGKVVWFRDVNFLQETVTGRNKDVKDRLDGLSAIVTKGIPKGQNLVVSASKLDKRQAFYKEFKKSAEVIEFEVPDKAYLAEKRAGPVVADCFRKAGLKAGSGVVELFLDKVGTDTRQIVNEVEKLAVFLGSRKDVKVSDIEAVTSSSREAAFWDLADAVGSRDLKRALEILRQLVFQGESPIGLIVSLENKVRELLIYREALDNGWLAGGRGPYGDGVQWAEVPPEIDGMLSGFQKDPRAGNPYRMKILAGQAERYSMKELHECRRAVLAAHEKLVSSGLPDEAIMEPLLVEMLS
jgi:DNA polymerase-3 subunit delta